MYLSESEARDNRDFLNLGYSRAEKVVERETVRSPPKFRATLLTAGDELSLVWEWQRRKNNGARDKLVRAFQPAIENVARKYPGRGLEFDDRVSLGKIGFLIALDKFDIKRRLRLWTYAHSWVRAEITSATAKCRSIVHRPRQKKNNSPAINGQVGWQWNSRWANLRDVELDAPVALADGGWSEAAEPALDRESDAEPQCPEHPGSITGALDLLSVRERAIFKARRLSDDPPTLSVLATEFGISAERTRQIEAVAFEKVATAIRASGAPRYGAARAPSEFSGFGISFSGSEADERMRGRGNRLSRSYLKNPHFQDRAPGGHQ